MDGRQAWALDAAGNLYRAGFGWGDLSIDGLSRTFEGQSAYTGEFNAAGTPRWLQAFPIETQDVVDGAERSLVRLPVGPETGR
jgi:hypothetical protein